jgi:hypothetical protein
MERPKPGPAKVRDTRIQKEIVLEQIDNTVQDRRLFILAASRIDDLAAPSSLPCRHFACLVA